MINHQVRETIAFSVADLAAARVDVMVACLSSGLVLTVELTTHFFHLLSGTSTCREMISVRRPAQDISVLNSQRLPSLLNVLNPGPVAVHLGRGLRWVDIIKIVRSMAKLALVGAFFTASADINSCTSNTRIAPNFGAATNHQNPKAAPVLVTNPLGVDDRFSRTL